LIDLTLTLTLAPETSFTKDHLGSVVSLHQIRIYHDQVLLMAHHRSSRAATVV
jgi:hypothetical protein